MLHVTMTQTRCTHTLHSAGHKNTITSVRNAFEHIVVLHQHAHRVEFESDWGWGYYQQNVTQMTPSSSLCWTSYLTALAWREFASPRNPHVIGQECSLSFRVQLSKGNAHLAGHNYSTRPNNSHAHKLHSHKSLGVHPVVMVGLSIRDRHG